MIGFNGFPATRRTLQATGSAEEACRPFLVYCAVVFWPESRLEGGATATRTLTAAGTAHGWGREERGKRRRRGRERRAWRLMMVVPDSVSSGGKRDEGSDVKEEGYKGGMKSLT